MQWAGMDTCTRYLAHLPWPPSVNRYWRNIQGRTLVSREGRDYQLAVQAACAMTGQLTNGPLPMLGRLAVDIVASPPDRRRRDLDNLLKATLDALGRAGIYDDDSQIDTITISRAEVDAYGDGAMVVEITEKPADE